MPGVPRPSLGWFDGLVDFTNDRAFYILVLVLAVASYFLLRRLLSSCFGSILTGIRENEDRMCALGYNTRAYKVVAFAISGALTGLAGGLFAQQLQLVTPDQVEWQLSAMLMIMVILGGSGSLIGPVIGALVIVLLQNVVSSYTDRWATIMALMFIGVVMFGRGGIWGLVEKIWPSGRRQS
jgi:branched-chain amino acid transport system permease protein